MNYKLFYFRKYKFEFFLIIFIFSHFSTYSQSDDTLEIQDKSVLVFDSLVSELNNATIDTVKVNMLNEIAWEFAPTNFAKSILFADSARALAKKIRWKKGEAIAIKNAGEALRFNGKVEESILKFETCLPIFKKLNDKSEIARVYNHIGLSNLHLSKLEKAYEYYNKALDIYKQNDNKEGMLKGFTYLGTLFKKFNDFDKSLKYYEMAQSFAKGLDDKPSFASLHNNIGSIYSKLNNYPEALKHFRIAEKVYKKLNNTSSYSILLGNLGNLYFNQKQYKKALFYIKKTMSYRKKNDDKYGIAYQSTNLARIYLGMSKELKDKDESKKNSLLNDAIGELEKSIVLFGQLGNKVDKLDAILLLANIYNESRRYDLAYETQAIAKSLDDSIKIYEVNKTIANLEFQQNLSLKQKEIEILHSENEYNKLIKVLLIGIALIMIIFVIYLYQQNKGKKRHARILEENIEIREKAEIALKKNENELKKHKAQLELIVKKRTAELEREINERKLTEEDLLIAIDRVESANKAKSIFLENMSHELRTPLVGILGYSQLLHSEIEDKEFKEMADGINRTGNRLLNTLSMVLDLARIESDKFEINITEIDVESELKQIYNSFKGAVAIKNIDFSLKLCDECKTLFSDAGMFKVIVENLVNNAIKFTKKGEIIIESEIEKIDSVRYFLINVIDTGIGIKRSEISMIFNEFKQLSEGTVKDFQGTGLGLSISKKFIEHLNGELLVESEFGVGSKFTLKFPYY